MDIKIDGRIRTEFTDRYEKFMLETCGDDILPNPHGAKHGIFVNYRPWEYDQVVKRLPFEGTILDIGALHTYLGIYITSSYTYSTKKYIAADSFYWAKRSYNRLYGMQTPEEWCDYMHEKSQGCVEAQEADMTDMPWDENTFDHIISISTIEHVENDLKGMEECLRVLKPGGTLLMTTEFHPTESKPYNEDDGSFYRIYNTRDLTNLIINSGFDLPDVAVQQNNHKPNTNIFVALTKP